MRAKNPNPKVRARCEGLTIGKGKWNGKIRLLEENLEKPLKRKKPTTWAVWNDLFHEDVAVGFITRAFDVMRQCPQHTFIILTKRPAQMSSYLLAEYMGSRWPIPNAWIGVTCENQKTADERIPILCQIPAAVRFVSAEPLLGPINFPDIPCPRPPLGAIDWIIAGAESGSDARPMDENWIRQILDDCQISYVPFFYKQAMRDGKMVKLPKLDGYEWREFPDV